MHDSNETAMLRLMEAAERAPKYAKEFGVDIEHRLYPNGIHITGRRRVGGGTDLHSMEIIVSWLDLGDSVIDPVLDREVFILSKLGAL